MGDPKLPALLFTRESTPIVEALRSLDEGGMRILLVVDEAGVLQGTVTDGDVRRAILHNIGLTEPVHTIMNREPMVGKTSDSRDSLIKKMRAKHLFQIPIIDDERRVVGIETVDKIMNMGPRNNLVVLMAGGEGKRLRPLTENCPKPLLKVGDRPILERIIENFMSYGFSRFLISVNYRADMIIDHFADGERWGAKIDYLREDEFLGTAGALGLIDEPLQDPVIVMNGDLLTTVNLGLVMDFHRQHRADITMCVREYDLTIPYGVVSLDGDRVVAINEKPNHKFFVNAGIYILQPSVIASLTRGERIDMTSLIEKVQSADGAVHAFPIRETWLDIGQLEDFERANAFTSVLTS